MKFADYIAEQTIPSILSKEEQETIKEYILDALKEFKISVRAVEYESRSIMVYYNFGKESPAGYRDNREDISAEIVSEVNDILLDVDKEVSSIAKKLEAENVGLVRFTLKK